MVSAAEFKQRRQRLLAQLDADCIAIVAAAPEQLRNGDAEYAYRQDSDFYYLTGFDEPESVAVFASGSDKGDYILFTRDRDIDKEKWVGRRAGQAGACEEYGADAAFSIQELTQRLSQLFIGRRRIYYPYAHQSVLDKTLKACLKQAQQNIRSGAIAPDNMLYLDSILHEMRLIKSANEIALMRRAAEISAQAHCRAMQVCKPGLYEYQLEAEFLYEFTRHGARAPAYNSIVGGGANACILHYVENQQTLKDGDLVLIDAGAEYQYYAADITRTFPVNGRFTPEQKALYELVLEAQLAAIEQIKPGHPWDNLQTTVVEVLTQGLIDLGILKGECHELIESKAYRDFYFHNVGHWLGMDVHDVGAYKIDGQWRGLEAGVVLTVEPGLYIAPDNLAVDEKWRGLGIRIEDDVLVTETGYDVLSAAVPKTVADIEAMMAA